MTREKPILFSSPMIRAILAGRKTVTRRLVKPQPSDDWRPVIGRYHPTVIDRHGEEQPGPEVFGASDENEGRVCPFGEPGDRLWVREAHSFLDPDFKPTKMTDRDHVQAIYRADHHDTQHGDGPDQIRWRPSIHMPRWASRITLEICDVRVERLADISDGDVIAEGIPGEIRLGNRFDASNAEHRLDLYRELWSSTFGADSWASSPWVWVIGFRRIVAGE